MMLETKIKSLEKSNRRTQSNYRREVNQLKSALEAEKSKKMKVIQQKKKVLKKFENAISSRSNKNKSMIEPPIGSFNSVDDNEYGKPPVVRAVRSQNRTNDFSLRNQSLSNDGRVRGENSVITCDPNYGENDIVDSVNKIKDVSQKY